MRQIFVRAQFKLTEFTPLYNVITKDGKNSVGVALSNTFWTLLPSIESQKKNGQNQGRRFYMMNIRGSFI